MRRAGQIINWNDERGFGFVVPADGGEQAFVHIGAFPRGTRRPVAGDRISYVQGKDASGRVQTRKIRLLGETLLHRPTWRLPRAALGLITLVVIGGLAWAGVIPHFLAWLYLGCSCLSYLLYGFDKRAARRDGQRTPENTLHLMDLLGGWPGALVAQQQFHHKTIKRSYQWVFWLTVAVNLAAAWWLTTSGTLQGLLQLFRA